MFDIGFSEILLIFGLALIVLGPEKLPRVASQVGRWIGRARGMARQFREQLEEEVNLEEARKSRPPAITQSPAGTPPPVVAAPAPAVIEPPSAPIVPTSDDAHGASMSDLAAAQVPADPQPQYPDHYSHAHPADAEGRPLPPPAADAAVSAASEMVEPSAQPQQHPDGYSHAHPTDSEGRPVPPPASEAPATESSQHDWVGVPAGDTRLTSTDKPAQGTPAAGYAPPHERGT